MLTIPAQHQTDPAKMPGQIINRPTQGEAFCARVFDGVSAEEKQALLDGDAFKPARDLPQGWDHV